MSRARRGSGGPGGPRSGGRGQQRGGDRRDRSRGGGGRSPHEGLDQLEGRNVVREALERGRRKVHHVWIDERAGRDEKITAILTAARAQGSALRKVQRGDLDEVSQTGVHNGVMAWASPLPEHSVKSLLDEVSDRGEVPFVVLVDEATYEHNLGAVLRSALGAGVHGVIVPVRRGKGLSPVVQRVAMGGAEAVPLVREGLSSALAELRRRGVRIVGADMDGEPHWSLDLTGALALVIGGESKGLTSTLRDRCDAIAAVPLAGGLESLNLSVTAAVLMFERARQVAAAT